MRLKTEVELAKARADAERVKRREAERVEAPGHLAAAEAEERARAKIEELVAPVVAVEESVAGAAKGTVETVEAVSEGAKSTTRCSSKPRRRRGRRA